MSRDRWRDADTRHRRPWLRWDVVSNRFLMLVSARADAALRAEVARGSRPCPEYLRLEERHGIELLDWSRLGPEATGRSVRLSTAHARAALRRLHEFDAVFSDGEHVGVPLALAMRLRGPARPHLMLGHHLTTPAKRRVFRVLRPQARITRVIVHSRRQLDLATRELGIRHSQIAFVPYFADTDFWRPGRGSDGEEHLVVAVGREHRDYATMAAACGSLDVRAFVAAGSLHSPAARQDKPLRWPANFEVGFADQPALRTWYGRAAVVVVPLVPTEFQAGVTTILEAMAMGRPVVVSATAGQRDIVQDGVTGVMVPPGDARALEEEVRRLLGDPAERRRLGANAREAAVSEFSLDAYTDRLAAHLHEIADGMSRTRSGPTAHVSTG
jgi:glycosyltransferase involved in cell wall biosynthesis